MTKTNPVKLCMCSVVIIFFAWTNVQASNYYWVGGSGNWSDYGHHWATNSGGLIFHTQIPGPNDDVFFDANSFSASGANVNPDSTFIYCRNMSWTGVLFNPAIQSGTFNVYGSITLTNNMNWMGGNVNLFSNSVSNTLLSSGHNLGNLSFYGTSNWSMNDELTCNELLLNNGTFNSNSYNIFCSHISTNNVCTLLLNNSLVTGCNIDFSNASLTLDADSADFNLVDNGWSFGLILNCGDHIYHNVVFSAANHGSLQFGSSTFNNVEFLNYAQINGWNAFFHKLICNSEVNISGNGVFDSLIFNNAGHSVNIGSGSVLNINNTLIADGLCGSEITFISSPSNGAVISKTTGTVTCSFLIMQHIHATGGASFTANNSVDLGNNTGWTINGTATRNLYWVGGKGNWSDANHWSLISGGAGGNCVPTLNDSVFFDANSFQQLNDTIFMDVPIAYCKNLDFNGTLFSPCITAGSYNIYGSLRLTANLKLQWTYIKFLSTQVGNTITSAGHYLGNLNFEGVGGSWVLNDSLWCFSISNNQAVFNTNGFSVNCNSIKTLNSSTLLLDTSTIYGTDIDFSNPFLTLDADSANFIFRDDFGSGTNELQCGNNAFHNVTFTSNNLSSLSAGNSTFNVVEFLNQGQVIGLNPVFHKAIFNSDVDIGFNVVFDSLIFNNAGHSVYLGSGSVLTINNAIIADGLCGKEITFYSSQSIGAVISKSSGAVTCSYLIIQNIRANGGASFTANNSVSIGNTTGWTINGTPPRNMYWVGGIGNWSDAAHWSLASGGLGGNCVPTLNDSVFFDDNSFNLINDTVYMDSPIAYCKNLDFNVTLSSPVITYGNISLYGSLRLGSNITWMTSNLHLLSSNQGNIIESAGNNLGSISFEGTGSWSLTDGLRCFNLDMNSGLFNSNGFDIDCERKITANNGSELQLNGSTISCPDIDFSDPSIILNADSADFVLNDVPFFSLTQFQCGTHSYKNVIFNSSGLSTLNAGSSTFNQVIFAESGQISGYNTLFHKVVFLGDASIIGDNTFDTLFFNNPGNTVSFGNNVQTINNELFAHGLPAFPISIQCPSSGISAVINKTNGNVCLNYVIMQNIHASGGAQFFAGDYSIDLGNNTGWNFSSCTPDTSDVWPGDANYDLLCNNMDILNIGLAYNDTGYVRTNTSLAWQAQPGINWLSQFITGINAKHADCDGNGIVNALDTLAVSLNYGLIHPRPVLHDSTAILSGSSLFFDLPVGNLQPGSPVTIPIVFGTPANPVDNLYGIAFSIVYDQTLIQPGSMVVDYNGSWVVNANNYIHLEKDFSGIGKYDLAVCRINHQNISGNGIIATLNFTVANNAVGLLSLFFSDVMAISSNELQIAVNTQSGSIPTSIAETGIMNTFEYYPNPVRDYIYMHCSSTENIQIEIINSLGQIVMNQFISSKEKPITLFTGDFTNGIYVLRITDTKKGLTMTRKFLKM